MDIRAFNPRRMSFLVCKINRSEGMHHMSCARSSVGVCVGFSVTVPNISSVIKIFACQCEQCAGQKGQGPLANVERKMVIVGVWVQRVAGQAAMKN